MTDAERIEEIRKQLNVDLTDPDNNGWGFFPALDIQWLLGQLEESQSILAFAQGECSRWRKDYDSVVKERDKLTEMLSPAGHEEYLLLLQRDSLLGTLEAVMKERDKLKQDMHLTISNAGKDLIKERDEARAQFEKVTRERDSLFLELGKFADIPSFEFWRDKAMEARAEAENLWSAYTLSGSQLPPLPWKKESEK